MNEGIRSIEIQNTNLGRCKRVRLVFGPHYFVELIRQKGGKISFVLGATHHGFKVDASEVGGDLEKLINEIRDRHPKTCVD